MYECLYNSPYDENSHQFIHSLKQKECQKTILFFLWNFVSSIENIFFLFVHFFATCKVAQMIYMIDFVSLGVFEKDGCEL